MCENCNAQISAKLKVKKVRAYSYKKKLERKNEISMSREIWNKVGFNPNEYYVQEVSRDRLERALSKVGIKTEPLTCTLDSLYISNYIICL